MPQCIVNMKAQPEYTNSGKVSMCMLAMSIIYDEAKVDKKTIRLSQNYYKANKYACQRSES
ncbi:hypothetical protein B8W87_02630 [Rothia dentocariosa]|uniref:Uncharacterized protein n=1 Tax=Rothia dentocariosa TaxID=2047 RepID=A0AAE5NI72_9MICC|nr:hypothetical protein HMPREF2554_05205 [Rothia sp. HMSC071F11]PAK86558.1 hypothetical protein B8W87_02630 [Rothia dentocariosa]